MKKTVLRYGALAAVILAASVSVTTAALRSDAGYNGMVFGYLSMLIAFAFIFGAVKSYRDRTLGGAIPFGRALAVGLWITLIGSLAYTLTWVILYKTVYPSFMTDYTAHLLAQKRAAGASAAELQAAAAEARSMQAVYETWPGLIGFTMLEVAPVGVLVSGAAALILKRRGPRVAGATGGGQAV